MSRRTDLETIGTNVSIAILDAGTDVPALAQATGLTLATLKTRLLGESEFSMGELVTAGGFLRTPVGRFLNGVPA